MKVCAGRSSPMGESAVCRGTRNVWNCEQPSRAKLVSCSRFDFVAEPTMARTPAEHPRQRDGAWLEIATELIRKTDSERLLSVSQERNHIVSDHRKRHDGPRAENRRSPSAESHTQPTRVWREKRVNEGPWCDLRGSNWAMPAPAFDVICALRRARCFALVESLPEPTKARSIICGSGTQSAPLHPLDPLSGS